MDIAKEGENLIVKIPLWQKSFDAADEYVGDTHNVIGVIAGDEFTLSHLVDLGYKGAQQEGSPIVMFDSREELEKLCKEHGIQIWEHEICDFCKEPMRGSFTYSSEGKMCYSCELEKRK
jgi:hypothetical protein